MATEPATGTSATHNPLKVLQNDGASAAGPEIHAKKPPVEPATLRHKELVRGPFWQKIPAYAGIDEKTFLDHTWQAKNSITKV